MKYKVGEDVALQEFARMCAPYRIEKDESKLSAEELAQWQETRDGIVELIRRGSLVVGEDGTATYTPEAGKSVTFARPTGATILALETYPKDKQVANLRAAMADMCGVGADTFAKMWADDFTACCRIAALFLPGR